MHRLCPCMRAATQAAAAKTPDACRHARVPTAALCRPPRSGQSLSGATGTGTAWTGWCLSLAGSGRRPTSHASSRPWGWLKAVSQRRRWGVCGGWVAGLVASCRARRPVSAAARRRSHEGARPSLAPSRLNQHLRQSPHCIRQPHARDQVPCVASCPPHARPLAVTGVCSPWCAGRAHAGAVRGAPQQAGVLPSHC